MDPFIGQVSIVGFNFAPRGWAFCNGSLLSIQQNTALFSILGTTYGGDGVVTFALPNLQGRAAMHPGPVNPQGAVGGAEAVQLTQAQMPAHAHNANAVHAAGTAAPPTGAVWAGSARNDQQYSTLPPGTTMAPSAVAPAGSNVPHDNMPPVTVMNFIIAMEGIYPSRN